MSHRFQNTVFKTDQEAHFHNYHNKTNKGSAIQTKLIHFPKTPQNDVSFLWFLSFSYTSGNNLPESTFLLAVATRCNTAVWHRTKHRKYGWVHGQSNRMISELQHFKLNYVQHQGCMNSRWLYDRWLTYSSQRVETKSLASL